VAVPLIYGNTILGALDVESSEIDAFTQEDVLTLRTLADQVATATHEARLYAAEREQAWISTALLQVSEATAQASGLDEVLDTVTRITPMLSGVDRCGILLWDPIQEAYRAASSYGLEDKTARFNALRLSAESWADLRLPREVAGVVMLDSSDPRIGEAFAGGATLALPLYARGEMAGVMLVGAPEGQALPARKAALLVGIANQAALAIESAQLLAAQREEAWVNMALLQVAEAVGSQTELHDILTTVVRLTPLLVGVDACLIFLFNSLYRTFEAGEAYGLPRSRLSSFAALSAPADEWQVIGNDLGVPRAVSEALGLRAPQSLALQAKGETVGVMVIDGDSEEVTRGTRRSNILAGIASQTAMAIVNAQLAEESLVRQRLEQELRVARKIQESFLPDRNPSLPGWQIAAMWRSARQVGGDFYDFIAIRDDAERLGVAIADVADKGVPAALFMALCRTLLRVVAIGGRGAAEALIRTNDLILNDARSDLFVTIFYVVLDASSGQVRYANAGHNPPLLVRAASRAVEYLSEHGIALGVMPNILVAEQARRLAAGDVLVLYTDGVTEALNDANEEFGVERLERCTLECLGGSADDIAQAINHALRAYVGDEPPFDDITLVVLKRVGA
jgi:serine phosphatase RsbU (regulator of sigma subunit)